MTFKELNMIRFSNLQVSRKKFKDAKGLLNYLGAVQAQDYSMSKWAVGLRLKEANEKLINTAIDKGDILRTHLLRPTWHFVSADNIYWMLELTAQRIKKSMHSRNKELGLTSQIFSESNKIIREALKENNHLTREAIIKLLNEANIQTDKNRASHLLAEAELTGIICSGIQKGNKITYALLDERVKNNHHLTRDEYLIKLARIFFTTRGPASVNDFVWWSGLTISDARKSLEMIRQKMNSIQLNSQIYWFYRPSTQNLHSTDRVYLLPAFDEFLISYKDRSMVLISESHRKIISQNGMFRAIIVYEAKIIGIWKRISGNNFLDLQMTYFDRPVKKIKNLVTTEAEKFVLFTGKKIHKMEHIF